MVVIHSNVIRASLTFVRWSFCQPDFNTAVELHHFIDTI